ncbi:MAG: hypothetical protein IFK94_09920 [Acidobacteria bacterium]|uniref:histidine kinase n=1 Tax=Candidatus Polarisedimenticola svalbardensis TaxID=2886004 RepID=A0A8J7CDA4_9BACT|nr:hypothetical protein [Candidatus Polarisedimenticola svalbardensis]
MAGSLRVGRFGFQVRLVLVLLVLLLGILNLLNSFMVGRARSALERSELSRAESISREYIQRIGRPPFMAAVRPGSGGNPVTSSSLRIAAQRSGLSQVRLLDISGRTVASSGPSAGSGPDPYAVLETKQEDDLAAGRTVSRILDESDTPEGVVLAVHYPLLDHNGRLAAVVETLVPAQDLADLNDRANNILGVQILGVLLIAIVAFLFADWVSRPYRKIAAVAGEAGLDPGEPDHLVSAFRTVVRRLKEQEETISTLERKGAGLGDLVRFASRSADGMSTGVLVLDGRNKVAALNDTASRLLSVPRDNAVGQDLNSVVGSAGGLELLVRASIKKGESATREVLEVQFRDGRSGHLGVSVTPSPGSGDRNAGALILMTDLTEIKHLQDQARLRENMAAVGTLSAGIAHEFRNALGTILGYARLLEKHQEDGVRRPAREILKEVDTVRKAVDEFLLYARPPEPSPSPLELEPLIRGAVLGAPENLKIEVEGEFGTVVADDGLLRRVFDNLLRNAAEAGESDDRPVQVRISGWVVASGRTLQVEVEDDGPGIPAEDLSQVFVPFHTTRRQGTGLGLALVQRTMVDLGGGVEAANGSEGGALFRLRFPLIQGTGVPA